MKILILLPNDFLGGAEHHLKMIATSYNGQEVDIVFLKPRGTTSWEDVGEQLNLHYCPTGRLLGSLCFLVQFLLQRRHQTYDYVFTSHVYMTGLVGFCRSLKLINCKKFIARESTAIFRRFKGLKLLSYKMVYVLGYRHIDLLICQTDFMREQLLEGAPYLAQRMLIKTIPNPIDLQAIREKAQSTAEAAKITKYLVSAGRLIPEKGFDLLIEAFAKSIAKLGYTLLILGEGKEREPLSALIKVLNMTDKVILWGHVPNVYPFFKYAKVCVVSSRIEGFPNVLLQMMSQNSKVVSTLCAGGIAEIPGIHTCSPGDVNSLAAAIEESIGDTTDYRNQFDTYLASRSLEGYLNSLKAALV